MIGAKPRWDALGKRRDKTSRLTSRKEEGPAAPEGRLD
jgi:hypothetical protein